MAQSGPLRALTVEALTDLLASKKTDVTKQKLSEIDFSSDKFRLETLENIINFYLHENGLSNQTLQ